MPGLVTPELGSVSGQPEIPGVRRCEGGRVVKVVVSIILLRGGGGGGAIIAGLTIGMLRLITIITLRATAITTLPLSLAPNPFHPLCLSPSSDRQSRDADGK